MPTRLQKWTLLLSSAAVLALPVVSLAQLSTNDIDTRLGTESHVGNIAGHAKDAKGDYRRYCVGCHGDLGDGMAKTPPGLTRPCIKSHVTSSWGTLSAAPLRRGLYPPIRIFRCHHPGASTAPYMPQWNTLSKQERADLVAWVKHFSPRWVGEKPGTPITIPLPSRKSLRSASRRGVSVCQDAMLEVPRGTRHGQRTVRFDASG